MRDTTANIDINELTPNPLYTITKEYKKPALTYLDSAWSAVEYEDYIDITSSGAIVDFTLYAMWGFLNYGTQPDKFFKAPISNGRFEYSGLVVSTPTPVSSRPVPLANSLAVMCNTADTAFSGALGLTGATTSYVNTFFAEQDFSDSDFNNKAERKARSFGLFWRKTALSNTTVHDIKTALAYVCFYSGDIAWYEQLPDGTNRLRTDFPIQDTVDIRGLYVGNVANAPDTYEESIYSPKTVSY
jgi:hypothetical protein